MRDVVLALIVFGALPFVFKRPYIGVLLWVWLSIMNPHRMTYGFAYNFPFAAIVAGVTFLSMLMSKDRKDLPMTPPVLTLIMFGAWVAITTAVAFLPAASLDMLSKVEKILLMTLVTIMLVRDRDQLNLLIITLCASLGFYGVKGGIFTIRSGGTDRVWGPPGSFIEGNNEVALAFVTLIPLLYYVARISTNKWVRWGVYASMGLCGLAALGSYSRGALVAISAMVLVLWWRSPKKLAAGVVMALVIPVAIAFMPDKWGERMDTIQTYEEDQSAMGRINAWAMAFNLAKDNPITGGGFVIYDAPTFALYAPNPTDIHAAHSIYFQVLGEHGFVGLGLFVLLAFLVWRRAAWIIKSVKEHPDLRWAADLASMVQVGLVGFAVGGAFLSLAYYDLPYYLMAIIVIAGRIVEEALKERQPGRRLHRTDSQPKLRAGSSMQQV